MNLDKILAGINECSIEELNRIQNAVIVTRNNKYGEVYDRIEQHFIDTFEELGAAHYGFVLLDGYGNSVTLYPSELVNREFKIQPYNTTDKPRCKELDLDLPREDRD